LRASCGQHEEIREEIMAWNWSRLSRWRQKWERLTGCADADLAREIRAHLDQDIDERRDAGASAQQARDAAKRAFGSVSLAIEDTRAVWHFAWIERVWQDATYALRLMRRSPGFTTVVVLSLALGIGANSAIFSVMDVVLLKSLPVKHPEQLYMLIPAGSKGFGAFSYPGFDTLRRANQAFSDTFNYSEGDTWNVIAAGHAELTNGASVTGNYFSALGIEPMAGRLIVESDDVPSAARVAVISYRLWQQRFGLDPGAIGTVIRVNNAPVTIVGVAPPAFSGLSVGYPNDIWMPMAINPLTSSNSTWWLLAMGRLKPGVTEAQARASLDLATPIVRQTMGVSDDQASGRFARIDMTSAAGGLSPLSKEYEVPLYILMIVVGLVLLIACANVANLLLSRAKTRRREMAIRLALGGGRRRLLQQMLVESLLLATLAGALGLVIASWIKTALVGFFATQRTTFGLDLPLDARVLGFTLAVSLLTGILFGLMPALRATQLDPGNTLKEQTRAASAGSGSRQPLTQALIVLQVALSLLLLTGAGLFLRTLQNLRHIDLGFEPEHVMQMTIEPGLAGYDATRVQPLYRELLDRLNVTPGVIAASGMRFGMISGGYSGRNVFVPGAVPVPDPASPLDRNAAFNIVAPRFFETMGITLTGREFNAGDTAASPKVAIVNEKLARHLFGTDAVIGRRIGFDAKAPGDYEIVGVVHDTKYFRLRGDSPRAAFVAIAQAGPSAATLERLTIAVRTAADPASMAGTMQRTIQGIAPDVPIRGDIRTLRATIDATLGRERLLATLSTLFGALALLLACIGLYGVMSYAVVRRTTEIGIRMALGAHRRDVLQMILRDSTWLVAAGLITGLIAALLTARLVESQLFALNPTDPATLGIACAILITAAAIAALLPAWRAARVDPMIALRHE
jgi:macrolide transport system ATP-binding/permease protein